MISLSLLTNPISRDIITVIILQITALWLSRRWINLLKVIQVEVLGQGLKLRKVRRVLLGLSMALHLI